MSPKQKTGLQTALGRQREDVLRDVVNVTQLALAAGRYDVALRGLELEAKLLGLLVQRQQVDLRTEVVLSKELMAASGRAWPFAA